MRNPDRGAFTEVAPGVTCFFSGFVNVYAVELREKERHELVLVDAGLSRGATKLRRALEQHYGTGVRPRAIVLTHGHFDHAGSAPVLAEVWNVPVYAHPLELPYLTCSSRYAPPDPTVGGALAFLSRFMGRSRVDLRGRVQPLPSDGSVPYMSGWRWLHTPGHTPGHVSYFRDSDRVLLSGDAVATVNQDSAMAMIRHKRQLYSPPRPFTTDWQEARRSIGFLANLRPCILAAGHGLPLSGAGLDEQLRQFAAEFSVPQHGRYAHRPALADASGLKQVPPAAPDRLPRIAAGAVLGAVVAAGFAWWRHRRAA